MPGVSAAVVLPDGTFWAGVGGELYGAARSMTPRTLFAAGSATKPYLAALVLKLAEKGSYRSRIGSFAGCRAFPLSRKITVRQLLNHTAGTKDFGESPALHTAFVRFARAIRNDEHARWTPEKTLSFVHGSAGVPGRAWRYSNTDYILLGIIVREVSRTSVDTALQTRLLRPRQLRELVLQPDAMPRAPLARGYSDADGDGTPEPVRGDLRYLPTRAEATLVWSAGGLAATPRGLARATDTLFRKHLLTASSLAQMTRFVDSSPPYGLGLANEVAAGVQLWGHYGEINGFQTEMWYLPDAEGHAGDNDQLRPGRPRQHDPRRAAHRPRSTTHSVTEARSVATDGEALRLAHRLGS